MFSNCENLVNLNIDYMDTQTVIDMKFMFSGFAHHGQARLHPLKKTVVRMPGPS